MSLLRLTTGASEAQQPKHTRPAAAGRKTTRSICLSKWENEPPVGVVVRFE